MAEDADDKIRSAIKTLGTDPSALESLLSVTGEARRAKLNELGLGEISRGDVQEFIEQDEVAGFAMPRPGGIKGTGPLHNTAGWAGVVATMAAGALAA